MSAHRRVYYAGYLVLILLLLALTVSFNISGCGLWGSKGTPAIRRITKTVVDSLYDDVRVLCMIPYNYNYPSTAKYVKRTWGRHCNVLLFVSGNIDDELEPYVPAINATDNWTLVHRGLLHAFEAYKDEADWFLKVEDSSFVVLENLRHTIHSKKFLSTAPIYFGHELENKAHKPFVFSQSGYVISREALRRYVDLDRDPKNAGHCQHLEGFTEALELGRCLGHVGVRAVDSRDEDGNETFMPVQMNHHFLEGYSNMDWLKNLTYHKVDKATVPLSKRAIAFRVGYPPEMYDYYYFVYRLQLFGLPKA